MAERVRRELTHSRAFFVGTEETQCVFFSRVNECALRHTEKQNGGTKQISALLYNVAGMRNNKS